MLRIPEGAIEFSDANGKKYINRTIEFNYNVDPAASVEMIEADGKVTVYNLAGERVSTTHRQICSAILKKASTS